jgi:prolyl-tRNA synthetase
LAPIQVAIVPIYKGDDQLAQVSAIANEIKSELLSKGISVKYDDDDNRKPGWKFAEYEVKGVPIRIAIGQRDIENGVVELARRDTLEKTSVKREGIADYVEQLLSEIQDNLFDRSKRAVIDKTTSVDNWAQFKEVLNSKGGFILAHWDGTSETELKIKEETKATIRCIPYDSKQEQGVCVYSGKPSTQRVLFAKAY